MPWNVNDMWSCLLLQQWTFGWRGISIALANFNQPIQATPYIMGQSKISPKIAEGKSGAFEFG